MTPCSVGIHTAAISPINLQSSGSLVQSAWQRRDTNKTRELTENALSRFESMKNKLTTVKTIKITEMNLSTPYNFVEHAKRPGSSCRKVSLLTKRGKHPQYNLFEGNLFMSTWKKQTLAR